MYLFFLPILKSVINEIENSKDGKPEYQGQKLIFYSSEKNIWKITVSILLKL